MKNLIFFPVVAFFILTLHPQELSHVTEVINVEVPVRVFDGDRFVDNLTLNDFELYENGVLQKVEAVYLIKRTTVHRREEEKRFAPKTSRSFFLLFEVYENIPKLYDSVSYFFNNVLNPEDSLVVVTPIKTYRMRKEALSVQSKEQLANQLNAIIRKDLLTGNFEYRNTLQDIADVARQISSRLAGSSDRGRISSPLFVGGTESSELGLEELLMMYLSFYQNLENLRSIDEKKLFDFAKYLKGQEGQKYVFLFYQREFFPQIDKKILIQSYDMLQDSPGAQQTLSELNDFRSRKIMINTDQIKKAYADSSISINFLFITTLPENIPGVTFKESSEDIFSPFLEMSKATGGFAASSANPASLMQHAAEASENYYLLYYSPKNYKSDGKFKEIKVKVKARNYRISNRAGYFAN